MQTPSPRLTPVIGLEIHARMLTRTKAFCGCAASSDAPPNSLVCPVCLGYPGALPTLNGEFARLTAMLGLALGCSVRTTSRFARKHYFYPDLPKGFQITQYDEPLCHDGLLRFVARDDAEREVRITRVHMEEDAGRLQHEAGITRIDFNRCGLPLAEIVTAPDLRSPAEAADFFREIRRILVHLDLCDGSMELGSLRCDANISMRIDGIGATGARTEIKNLNSFRFLEQALEYEARRQGDILRDGRAVAQETLLWDETHHRTFAMREKEESADYRYFPEPDLPPLRIGREWLEKLAATMPELPSAKRERWMREYNVAAHTADALLSDVVLTRYFERAVSSLASPSAEAVRTTASMAASAMLGLLHRVGREQLESRIPAASFALLIDHLSSGRLNQLQARDFLGKAIRDETSIDLLLASTDAEPALDEQELISIVDRVIDMDTEAVAKFRAGKRAAFDYLVGRILHAAGGIADPRRARAVLEERLQEERD